DKSVSKWERGEGIPGIYVLTCIAKIYGVTVNDLLAAEPPKPKRISRYNNAIITLLSFGLVWLVATFAFILLKLIIPTWENAWWVYLFAIPANAIVAIVFTCLWWPRYTRFLSVSALIWSSVVCLVCTFPDPNMKLFFILAGVFQGLVVLWFMLRKTKKKSVPETDESENEE
ncbi:MAG: helix-turn-helix transcriptional regulator, partial [Clostridia bacterium]|nr:helix-turn-helix transcriptional regulator [Clostridia bacterium]